jgi:type I restriction enzyme M protein
VECMVALPGQLFTNTQIPACIWFLTKNKRNGLALNKQARPRGKFLFIDARKLGYMKDRVLRDFMPEDMEKIADTFHAWRKGEGYEDEAGFCYSASLDDMRKHDYVLTPGRYVGAAEQEDDGEAFAEKMAAADGAAQQTKALELDKSISDNLERLGYGR